MNEDDAISQDVSVHTKHSWPLRIRRCIHGFLVGVQTGTESLKNSSVTNLKVNALNNVQLPHLVVSWQNKSVRVYNQRQQLFKFFFFFPLTAQRCVRLNSSIEMIVSDRLLVLLGALSAQAVCYVNCESRR